MKKEEKKAKESFSRYVRLRDCIKTTGSPEHGKCFTCDNIFPFEELQCGHFVSGRGNSLFFYPNNSHAQCTHCNCVLGGSPEIYRAKMIRKYGDDEVSRIEGLRHIPRKITAFEYGNIGEKFKAKFKRLNDS